MRPVYILLRESGWRGTDILNLRYDNCLDYLWSEKEKEYIPYLCGEYEINATGNMSSDLLGRTVTPFSIKYSAVKKNVQRRKKTEEL